VAGEFAPSFASATASSLSSTAATAGPTTQRVS
jgi:hypothetical protein